MGFYLGRGVTWVVCSIGCGLPRLVCFSEVTLRFSHFTYVVVVPGYMLWSKRIYLGWVAFCGVCCALPMFWRYLGTCSDRKEFT